MSLLWNCRYHLLLEQFVLLLLDPHRVVVLPLDLRLTHLVRGGGGGRSGGREEGRKRFNELRMIQGFPTRLPNYIFAIKSNSLAIIVCDCKWPDTNVRQFLNDAACIYTSHSIIPIPPLAIVLRNSWFTAEQETHFQTLGVFLELHDVFLPHLSLCLLAVGQLVVPL